MQTNKCYRKKNCLFYKDLTLIESSVMKVLLYLKNINNYVENDKFKIFFMKFLADIINFHLKVENINHIWVYYTSTFNSYINVNNNNIWFTIYRNMYKS